MTDRTRRLLIRRFELLALGGVLVDLAEDLVPLPRSAPDRPLYLYPQEPQFSGQKSGPRPRPAP